MIRQMILSGSFFDAGVKKLDTAFSGYRKPISQFTKNGFNPHTRSTGLDSTFLQWRGR